MDDMFLVYLGLDFFILLNRPIQMISHYQNKFFNSFAHPICFAFQNPIQIVF